jgi:hypothetical protein
VYPILVMLFYSASVFVLDCWNAYMLEPIDSSPINWVFFRLVIQKDAATGGTGSFLFELFKCMPLT